MGAAAVVAELEGGLITHGPRMSESGFWPFITTGPTTIPAVAQSASIRVEDPTWDARSDCGEAAEPHPGEPGCWLFQSPGHTPDRDLAAT